MLINVYRGKEKANDIDDIKLRISSKVYEKCLNVKHTIRFLFPKNYAYFHFINENRDIILVQLTFLCRTRKGPENLFEIERVRDRERKMGYSLHKVTETLVRHRERFEIESVRDKESQLYEIRHQFHV